MRTLSITLTWKCGNIVSSFNRTPEKGKNILRKNTIKGRLTAFLLMRWLLDPEVRGSITFNTWKFNG